MDSDLQCLHLSEQINIFEADSFPDQYLTPAQTDVYMYLESV